jgi:hypothetical protein
MLAGMGTASCELLFPNSGLSDGPDASSPSSDSPDAPTPVSDSPATDALPPESDVGADGDDASMPDPTNEAAPSGSDAAVDAEAALPEAQPDAQVEGASDDARAQVDAAAFVQMASATPPGSVQLVSAAFPHAQSAGDLNVVVIGWGDSTDSVMRVSDTAGNSYDLGIGPTRSNAVSQSIYYAKTISSAAANAVHVQFKLPVPKLDLRVLEYAQLDPIAPLDAVAGQSGFGGVPTSGPAVTHTAGEIIFGAGTTTDSFSDPGVPFTLRALTADGNIVEDRSVGSLGGYAADAVLSNGADWVMQAVTFRRR